jgi:hypothetical protein
LLGTYEQLAELIVIQPALDLTQALGDGGASRATTPSPSLLTLRREVRLIDCADGSEEVVEAATGEEDGVCTLTTGKHT